MRKQRELIKENRQQLFSFFSICFVKFFCSSTACSIAMVGEADKQDRALIKKIDEISVLKAVSFYVKINGKKKYKGKYLQINKLKKIFEHLMIFWICIVSN